MSVIEFAEKRQLEEIQADNDYLISYWTAYLDGARAQKREDDMLQKEKKRSEGGSKQWQIEI